MADLKTLFKIDDNVKNGRKIGIVRWVGRLPGKSGTFYGIEYAKGHEGKHNGSFNDVRYFTCDACQGAFVRTDSRTLKYNINVINKIKKTKKKGLGEVRNITVFQDLGDVDELGILNPEFQKNIKHYELTFINPKPWSYYIYVSLRDPTRKVLINGKKVGHEIPVEISKTKPLKIVSSSRVEGTQYYNLITKQEQSFREISKARKDFIYDFLYSIMGCAKHTSQLIMQYCGYEAPSSENLVFKFNGNQCIFEQCLNCRNVNFETKYIEPKIQYKIINGKQYRRGFASYQKFKENEEQYFWCSEFLCPRCGWLIKAYAQDKIKLITWAEVMDFFEVQLPFLEKRFREETIKQKQDPYPAEMFGTWNTNPARYIPNGHYNRYSRKQTNRSEASIKELKILMDKKEKGELFGDHQMILHIRDLFQKNNQLIGSDKYRKMEKKRQLNQERKKSKRRLFCLVNE